MTGFFLTKGNGMTHRLAQKNSSEKPCDVWRVACGAFISRAREGNLPSNGQPQAQENSTFIIFKRKSISNNDSRVIL